jgi:hypothetical protein
MKFRIAFFAIAAVLAFHILASFVGLYGWWRDLDVPMHFAGGFAMGLLALAIHHHMTDKHHLKGHPWWYHSLFILGFVMLVGVAWEFHEYLIDETIGAWWDWPKMQLSLSDTMLDFVMDGLGGFVALVIFRKRL